MNTAFFDLIDTPSSNYDYPFGCVKISKRYIYFFRFTDYNLGVIKISEGNYVNR